MAERISYLEERHNGKPERVQVGDIVKTGPNDYPRFKVIALDSGRAWLRNVLTGDDAIVSLEECCWRVSENNGPDVPLGQKPAPGDKPAQAKIGPDAPVEPDRMDRIFPGDQPSGPTADNPS
ncbi:MAG: hypothetical protein ACM3W4_05610 [Ignavibacteriales bacterium]